MSSIRITSLIAGLVALSGVSSAATPKEIDDAVQKGTAYLKGQFDKGAKPGRLRGEHGIGGAALSGLALLESAVPIDDPSVKSITAAVRDASFTETQTYHIALCLLYLDRLGDSTDLPVIQMLGIRLLAGQNAVGGWTYNCIDAVTPGDERLLRTSLLVTELKAGNNPPPAVEPKKTGSSAKHAVVGKLHPEVEKYAAKLAAIRSRNHIDDNSNTQFGILGVWAARKHGVPVENALDLIEKRFLASQSNDGGWPYAGAVPGSPSMTCAGLLGLATAIGRREERRLKAELPMQKDPFAKAAANEAPKKPAQTAPKTDDPFFNPPPGGNPDDPIAKKKPEAKKGAAKKVPADPRDAAVQRGFNSLAMVLAGNARQNGKGRQILIGDGVLGERDFYFLWSLERVGVVYGVDKIGGIDWYDLGADELVPSQLANGSWGRGGKGSQVDTSFALLFLARSNLVRDLSSKVQKDASNAELRAGGGPVSFDPVPAPAPMPATPLTTPAKASIPTDVVKPPIPAAPVIPAVVDPKEIAAELIASGDLEWDKALAKVRDAKGAAYTQALVLAIRTFEGDRRKSAREALAERLARMTGETLRTMVQDNDAELRRGAVLAMAMKDDRTHLPDLIAALLDEEENVVRAAKAGLKSITNQDFGPATGATLTDRTAAAKAWLEWLRKQN